ncbi:unnamed protein product [Anisakis simplex]|uniref:Small ribosomal subunit protein mS23 n=1 Tax=Anisakis simplex TaxID=6269 RepID=A0A0M3J5S9_ANISI|nr:unnamed protein product [Anisakis simplex]
MKKSSMNYYDLSSYAPKIYRVTGLIRAGHLNWEQRPLWYDVYAAIPPLREPVWDAKFEKEDEPVRKIFYDEDIIRAYVFLNQFALPNLKKFKIRSLICPSNADILRKRVKNSIAYAQNSVE